MDTAFWINLGIGGAVVCVVQLFLTHLKRERRVCERCRQEQHEVAKDFAAVVANHMRHETDARARLTEAIQSLEEAVRDALNAKEPTRR